jgi:hypothetical protein
VTSVEKVQRRAARSWTTTTKTVLLEL